MYPQGRPTRKSFVQGVSVEKLKKRTGFKPPDILKFKDLNPPLIRPNSWLDDEGPQPYLYPDFDRLKELEIQRLTKTVLTSDILKRMISIPTKFGPDKNFTIGETLLNPSLTSPSMNFLLNNTNYSQAEKDQLMALYINQVGSTIPTSTDIIFIDPSVTIRPGDPLRKIIFSFIIDDNFLQIIKKVSSRTRRIINQNSFFSTIKVPEDGIITSETIGGLNDVGYINFLKQLFLWSFIKRKNMNRPVFSDFIEDLVKGKLKFETFTTSFVKGDRPLISDDDDDDDIDRLILDSQDSESSSLGQLSKSDINSPVTFEIDDESSGISSLGRVTVERGRLGQLLLTSRSAMSLPTGISPVSIRPGTPPPRGGFLSRTFPRQRQPFTRALPTTRESSSTFVPISEERPVFETLVLTDDEDAKSERI